jgi:hypothetical protein
MTNVVDGECGRRVWEKDVQSTFENHLGPITGLFDAEFHSQVTENRS